MKTIRTIAIGALPVLLSTLLMGALVSTASAEGVLGGDAPVLDGGSLTPSDTLENGVASPEEGDDAMLGCEPPACLSPDDLGDVPDLPGTLYNPDTGISTTGHADGSFESVNVNTGERVEFDARSGIKVTTRRDGSVEVDFSKASATRKAGSVWMDVWPGGSVTETKGVSAIWVIHEGGFLSYTPGAPAWLNAKFLEAFPDGVLPENTPVLTVV